jgi:hypothetical protein
VSLQPRPDTQTILTLKTKLQEKVATFINEGKKIMSDWAEINIQLLIKDRCSDILTKALLILDSLTSYHTEILGMPTWPSVPVTHTTLFLFKLYLHNTILDITDLIHYLDLPTDTILLIGTKS